MKSPAELREERRLLGVTWGKLDGEAKRLDEMKSVILAECFNHHRIDSGSDKKAEMRSKADERYKTAITNAAEARTAANIALASVKAYELAFDAWRTMNATRRQEMKL